MGHRYLLLLVAGCFHVFACAGSAAQTASHTLVGPAEALSGDSLRLQNETIVLWGIATPALKTTTGLLARKALEEATQGKTVECKILERDAQNQPVARCYVGGKDLGKQILRAGLAVVHLMEPQATQIGSVYGVVEMAAKNSRVGIWRSLPQRPAAFPKFLKDWQTAIVGLIGFLGVILQIRNAIRSREQEAELMRERDDRLRANDACALAAALISELTSHKETLLGYVRAKDGMVEALDRIPPNRLDDPLGIQIIPTVASPLYASSLVRLGLLGQDQTESVASAYDRIEAVGKIGEKIPEESARVVGITFQMLDSLIPATIAKVDEAVAGLRTFIDRNSPGTGVNGSTGT